MKNPLKETLEQLNNHPDVIKAGAIGMERQLTIDMIEEIRKDIQDGNFATDPATLCSWIIDQIRNERHWKNFG